MKPLSLSFSGRTLPASNYVSLHLPLPLSVHSWGLSSPRQPSVDRRGLLSLPLSLNPRPAPDLSPLLVTSPQPWPLSSTHDIPLVPANCPSVFPTFQDASASIGPGTVMAWTSLQFDPLKPNTPLLLINRSPYFPFYQQASVCLFHLRPNSCIIKGVQGNKINVLRMQCNKSIPDRDTDPDFHPQTRTRRDNRCDHYDSTLDGFTQVWL